MCYFTSKGHDLFSDISGAYIERLILKELARTYENAFHNDDRRSFLDNELKKISDEIRVIYRNELEKVDDATLEKSIADVSPFIETISSNLLRMISIHVNSFRTNRFFVLINLGFRAVRTGC